MTTETTKRETKKAAKERERQEAIEYLRGILKPGDTVYCILRHVSKSGMFRRISLLDQFHRSLDFTASRILKTNLQDGKEGIPVGGCGMDMGFHLVSTLSYYLYADGFGCTGKEEGRDRCPSNDHSNGDRDYTPHGHRGPVDDGNRTHWHKSGDYAIRHSWL